MSQHAKFSRYDLEFLPTLQAGDDESGPQDEGVAGVGGGVAGDLADPPQPVAHGVRVDVEQCARTPRGRPPPST